MIGPRQITHAAALDAVQRCAVRSVSEDTGETRDLVHCFLGAFGADWDLQDALTVITESDERAWVASNYGDTQCLAVKSGHRTFIFDTVVPR